MKLTAAPAHMGVMEIIASQQAWNALPVNTFAGVNSRREGRAETLFVSRCAAGRSTMRGNHLIAGGPDWEAQFAQADIAAVLLPASGEAPSAAETTIRQLHLVQGGAICTGPDQVRAHVAASRDTGQRIPDRVALRLAGDLRASGNFPALEFLRSTGTANTGDLQREILQIRARNALRFESGTLAATAAADRASAMLRSTETR